MAILKTLDQLAREAATPLRLDSRWDVGDQGAVYEFNVKLGSDLRGVAIDDDTLYIETDMAVRIFADTIRKRYPWIGDVGIVGRSGGWLAIEDKKGGVNEAELKMLARDVEEARKAFVKAIAEEFGRESGRGHRKNGDSPDDAREFQRRRHLVGTTERKMPAGRTFTVVLENRGSDLGSRTDLLSRGKVVSRTYYLPPLPAFLKNGERPGWGPGVPLRTRAEQDTPKYREELALAISRAGYAGSDPLYVIHELTERLKLHTR